MNLRTNNFLVLFIIFCMISTSFPAYAFQDLNDKAVSNAVDVLSRFNIISGYPDQTFRPNNNITRAEFAKILITATQNELKSPDNTKFADVPDTHWAKDYIYISKSLGIVNGTSATTYSPGDHITYEQAIKMIVASLGYDSEAIQNGGWPNGYIKVANDLGILNGVTYEKTNSATRGNIAVIIRNALDVPFYFIAQDGDKIIREKSDVTLFKLHTTAKEFEKNQDELLEPDESTAQDAVG